MMMLQTEKKEIVLYATGGRGEGMGHLYRSLALVNLFFEFGIKAKILVVENFEENFFRFKQKKTYSPKELLLNEIDIFIIDSKRSEISKSVLALIKKSKKSIFVDNLTSKWVSTDGKKIIPSFYFSASKLWQSNKKLKNVDYGSKYVIPRGEKDHHISVKIDLLVTFGGSDPNNLTRKFLSSLSLLDFNKFKIVVILGPAFSENIVQLKKVFPRVLFLECVESTLPYVMEAKIIVTSLGTTLQEVELFNKKCYIICNYEDDLLEIDSIKQFSHNSNFWQCLGLYNDFQTPHTDSIEDFINITGNFYSNEQRSSWGQMWKNLVN
jgi:spore coat polysaccharide biosynthesis predicted glycosyltransferase SpsG